LSAEKSGHINRQEQRSWRYSTLIVAFFTVLLLNSGCAVLNLQKNLDVMAQTATISGRVTARPASKSPVFVSLYVLQREQLVLKSYWIAYDSGEFRFLVPPGNYYLFSFEDKNEDAAFQQDEWVGWYGKPSLIKIGPGEKIRNISLTLHSPGLARIKLPELYLTLSKSNPLKVPDKRFGQIVQLGNPRFGPEYASKGLWKPLEFLNDPGGGLFFLEPYDARKIPILFVHGFEGFPQQWRTIIQSLDRSRFQPWILYYPSGLRLGLLGENLEQYLAELRIRYRFEELYIIAHSMGGLIARSALNHQIQNRPLVFIKLIVTISTPWQGHQGAAYGVNNSPVIIPSWYDMVPESPFLKNLSETSLPEGVEFYLLFSFKGVATENGEISDGTVFLSSMLDSKMQQAASKIYGFAVNHCSMLSCPAVIDQINKILRQRADLQPASEGENKDIPITYNP